jgi:glycosyltransferase involved in cell wall biosynthesis
VVAVPENIYTAERGFRDFWSGRRGLAALERELEFLRRCHAVFCISREEQWLLRVQGIEADHLPYYPPRQLEEFLRDVRRRRRPPAARRFLLLGTALHLPTGRGLEDQLRALCSKPGPGGYRIDVAGRGTEGLKSAVASPNVVIHGTVSQEHLGELLAETSAAIIHQRPSVGALTRIPELLLAGVPVIANVDASRSAWMLPGVMHFDSTEELEALMDGPLPVPPVPERPLRAEQRFCEAVRELMARSR